MLSFVDNHDVTRVASILTNEKHLPLIYALMFGMPGIPCVYYGSEWGAKANKSEGDPALRACFEASENERVLVAINADGESYTAHFDAGCGQAEDLLTGQLHDFGGGSELPPYSAAFWKMER